jgi:hypothetical protein
VHHFDAEARAMPPFRKNLSMVQYRLGHDELLHADNKFFVDVVPLFHNHRRITDALNKNYLFNMCFYMVKIIIIGKVPLNRNTMISIYFT